MVGAALGCAPAGESEPPEAVECTVLYRPEAGSDAGQQEGTVDVPRQDGSAEPVTSRFSSLTFSAQYTAEVPDGSAVLIAVEEPDGAVLARHLYQVSDGSGLSTEFAGGHGFTGLQYLYHQGAELQHFCRASG